jgi:peroxiredoxin
VKRKSLTLLNILSLALLLIIVGCTGGNDDSAGDTGSQVVGPDVGNLAPDFNLKDLAGGYLSLSDHKGKAVLIDFWDTWCPPCRKAMPHLQELSEIYQDDLVVVGVALGREGEAKVRTFVEQNKLTFPFVLADAPDYTVLRDYGGIQSIPTSVLVDREGVIRQIWAGAQSKATYEKGIRQVLGV